jgi:NADH-quinone oxidoreductase subunit J
VPVATVKNIGDLLMTQYVLPLEVIGLLLTAALIGAVIIAMKEELLSKPGSSRGNEAHSSMKLEPPHVGCYESEKDGGHS